jgi:hypothetical protein
MRALIRESHLLTWTNARVSSSPFPNLELLGCSVTYSVGRPDAETAAVVHAVQAECARSLNGAVEQDVSNLPRWARDAGRSDSSRSSGTGSTPISEFALRLGGTHSDRVSAPAAVLPMVLAHARDPTELVTKIIRTCIRKATAASLDESVSTVGSVSCGLQSFKH